MRVCFLFNHDQTHQVRHSLPIALAMAEGGFDGEIILATTTPKMAQEVELLIKGRVAPNMHHVRLGLKPVSRFVAKLAGWIFPAAKLLVYRDNLDFFRSVDALVVAEKTSLLLKKMYKLPGLKIIHTRHGAGDRAIGFDKASAGFDHVLCSGPKIKERLVAEAGLAPEAISIVGYPKFDLARPALRVFPDVGDTRPIVLYNPHPSPHLSSWYKHGRSILDFFLANEEYRLIFAPHVMLFERPFVVSIDRLRIDRPGAIDDKYYRASNIFIDLGSAASSDMTYTQAADIYLGDVSSQIYEFLLTPRPCLFMNSHHHPWQGDPNYAHWQAGPVIDEPEQLAKGLRLARETHAARYKAVQAEMFSRSFDLNDTPSSQRAAQAIADCVSQPLTSPQARRIL